MSTLISKATGNFTAAGTWAVCNSTAEQDSDTSTVSVPIAYAAGVNFTPGAITVDAMAFKVSAKTGSSGTFTAQLWNSTSSLSVATVTVDVVDLPSNGWVVFPFTPTLLLAATNYVIRAITSIATQVTLVRSGVSTSDYGRQLRTTATAAPGAGDKIIVAGEHTGSGTGNNFTVTMDNVATTSFGAVSFSQSVTVNKRSSLLYGNSASTAYYLKVKGFVGVNDQGTFTIGTSGSPIPSTSSAVLEFDCTAQVDSGLLINSGCIFTTFGNALTYDKAFLNADAIATATSIASDVSTGWKTGDQIIIAATERTIAQTESFVLGTNASGTTITLPSGLAFAHSGTGIYKAELMNMTRNVIIRGTSAALAGYILTGDATINSSWTEYTNLGSSTTNKNGIDVRNVNNSALFDHCSFHDYGNGNSNGIILRTIGTDHVTVSNCNFYVSYIPVYIPASSVGNNVFFDNCWFGQNGYGIFSTALSTNINNCRFWSSTAIGCYSTGGLGKLPSGPITNCVAHTNASGFDFSGCQANPNWSNLSAWRNTASGFLFVGCVSLVIDTVFSTGNGSQNLSFIGCENCLIKNVTIASGPTFNSAYGIYIVGLNPGTVIYNASIGQTYHHTTNDLVFTGSPANLNFVNSSFYSPAEVSVANSWSYGTSYSSENHQGVSGSNKFVSFSGTAKRDTVIYNTASPSSRMTPAQTALKFKSATFKTTVLSGNTCTPSIYVRKSVAGDGTAYNGAQPRLVVVANSAAGILVDTVLATASGAAGSWELLSGTTAAVSENTLLEFYVDCDGTLGWINIDDFVVPAEDTSGLAIWFNGRPVGYGSGPLSSFTDVPTDKVELAYAYKYGSASNNRTGTRRQPTVGQVEHDVLYGPSDTLTGTYRGYDLWDAVAAGDLKHDLIRDQDGISVSGTYRALDLWDAISAGQLIHDVSKNQNGILISGTYRAYDLWGAFIPSQIAEGESNLQDGTSVTGTFGSTTPPTFGGITSLTANENGSLQASWSAASSPHPPSSYRVYIRANSDPLHDSSWVCIETYLLSASIFWDSSGVLLQGGTEYHMIVTAVGMFGEESVFGSSLVQTTASQGIVDNFLAQQLSILSDQVSGFSIIESGLSGTSELIHQDHLNFVSDHGDFLSDHDGFVSGHSDFVSDHLNFVSDHNNFLSDHNSFVSGHADFVSDHNRFVEDHDRISSAVDALDIGIAELSQSDLSATVNDADGFSASVSEEDIIT